jgi:hypothetical protein
MKGATAMIQELIGLLIMGLFGLFVVTVITMLGFGDDHHADDTRNGSASLDHHEGEAPHDRSSWQSNAI